MEYKDTEAIKKHIKSTVKKYNSKTYPVFKGIKELIAATEPEDEDSKPLLRRGQIIFGTVTIAHHEGREDHWTGDMSNIFAPLLTLALTGQARKYAYLHAAVYAGVDDDIHYVIENGGGFTRSSEGKLLGMVNACTINEAFESDARFFVLSPPKDFQGRSTRYMVLQRALASCGLFYDYHMRAVSCEAFALTMMTVEPEYNPIQNEVIKPER